jgi:uncharacterized protein YcnI
VYTKAIVVSLLLALAPASPALAHVTLAVPTATPGTSYKAVLRVPHGCDGAATTGIRVQIPEGYIAVKPMPKPGWTIAIKTGTYAQTYQLFGSAVTSGVTEIDWTGGNLPDAYYDEFVMSGQIGGTLTAGSKLYFPVVQECGTAVERWIMIPADGQAADDLKTPAPALTLIPATAKP